MGERARNPSKSNARKVTSEEARNASENPSKTADLPNTDGTKPRLNTVDTDAEITATVMVRELAPDTNGAKVPLDPRSPNVLRTLSEKARNASENKRNARKVSSEKARNASENKRNA